MLSIIRCRHVSFAWLIFGLVLVGPIAGQHKPSAIAARNTPRAFNIFDAQQELELGDIEAELLEGSYQVVPDAVFYEHVTTINKRLLASVAPGRANIRIILIDGPQASAFSAGSSRIYITRKMIAVLRNDDELAGLLGHEVAHILFHENAIVVSHLFHQFLGVSTIGDRDDIASKFSRIVNNAEWSASAVESTSEEMKREETRSQYDADRFALYAAAAAGFSPRAYAELFDRFARTHGKHGNLLTDWLGITTPEQRRSRQIYKSLRSLPKSCRAIPSPAPSPEFVAWQTKVTAKVGPTFPKRGSR